MTNYIGFRVLITNSQNLLSHKIDSLLNRYDMNNALELANSIIQNRTILYFTRLWSFKLKLHYKKQRRYHF
jgi:hypothetical protein